MNHKAQSTITYLNDRTAEQQLVAAARNGDEQAFEALFKRYQHKVLAVVRRYTRVFEDAEDIVQQSFQKAFVHLCKFQGNSSFSTWLTSIAINEALMFLRSIGAVREVSIDDTDDGGGSTPRLEIRDLSQDPEASCLEHERARILSSAINQLTPRTRRALELRELAEFSTEQTAQCIGVSIGAVKARVFQGKRKLRETLRSYIEADPISSRNPRAMGRRRAHILQHCQCNAPGV